MSLGSPSLSDSIFMYIVYRYRMYTILVLCRFFSSFFCIQLSRMVSSLFRILFIRPLINVVKKGVFPRMNGPDLGCDNADEIFFAIRLE